MEAKKTFQADIGNLLKYCLGYIKLINPAFFRSKLSTDPLEKTYFDPDFIFNIDSTQENTLPIHLKELYELNPKDLTPETEGEYLKQKALAVRLEEIKNKYKVQEYTKQINLNFGYFKVEVPEDENLVEEEEDEKPKKSKHGDIFPLFSIPVEILKIRNEYYLGILDYSIIPNLGFLQDVLGENSYYEFTDFVNKLEIDEDLKLPVKRSTIDSIWEELKGRLKLSDAQFDENSFNLGRIVVSLGSKSNYFLVQDLKKLCEMSDEEVMDSSLSGWVSEEDLSIEEEVNEDSGELFFPFDYDKHQLKVLSIINNKAAIVQGPPGTGKSQTIANLLCHLAAQGKRVLFLSQKAQALKVVKDKLKSLDIEFLYGYIPNRYSQLYTQEEEQDGAAYTLAGLQNYIHIRDWRDNAERNITIGSTRNLLDGFNSSINQQRAYFYLYNQFNSLENYDIDVPAPNKFLERFSENEYKAIQDLKKETEKLNDFCDKYVNENKFVSKLNAKYKNIDIKINHYSEDLDLLAKAVEKDGYDRGDRLGRMFVHGLLRFRLRNITSKLPRELYDDFIKIINKDSSKAKMKEELNILYDYCRYRETSLRLELKTKELDIKIVELGLGSKSFAKLEKLISNDGFEKAVESIKLRLTVANQIRLIEITNPNAVNKSLLKTRSENKERVKAYLRNRLEFQVIGANSSPVFRGIVARIAKALQKSKKAYKTFDNLKSDPSNFQTLKEVVPIWIMDLEDASRLIPLEKNLFDYIILDEASQCNLAYAMPAMYRSKHVLFFGDSEQMRDDSIKFKTNQSLEELGRKFKIPDYLQIKSKSDAVKSVLDVGQNTGFQERALLYHYRSPKELIGFSNENFYAPKKKRMEIINSNYLTYKNTDRIMINHVINADKTRDISDKTNLSEAEYIVKLIKQLKDNEKTKDKSIGVLTFFNEQAYLLKEMIEDDSVKVSIIEGIQGDEKDIIIYSFVITDIDQKKRYVPLTGEQGEINKELNQGRVNVAFSRARLQVHCVTSLPTREWPEGIWIKKYLEYIEGNGEISFYDQHLNKFDSYFEEEFYHFLRSNLSKNYIIQNQVESCGFKIDFVITDPKRGVKLALECDGPTHFEDEGTEVYVTNDIERQSVLEKAGWTFLRILYSDWVDEKFNRKIVLDDINDYFSKPSAFLVRFKPTEVNTHISSIQNALKQTEDHGTEVVQIEEPTITGNQKTVNPFQEIVRFAVDDRRDLVVSLIENGKSLWINEFIKVGTYNGFTNHGIGIGFNDLLNFINNSLTTLSNHRPTFVYWKGDGKSQILVRSVEGDIIDVRQFVESAKYTGFTRRGFRLTKDRYKAFITQLSRSFNLS